MDTRSPIVTGPASFTDTAPLQPRGFYRIALLPWSDRVGRDVARLGRDEEVAAF